MTDMNTENANLTPEKKTPWYLGRSAAIWGLLLVGPLALPLLWLSPQFKTRTKIIFTVITALVTYLSFLYTPKLIDTLMSRYDQLQGAIKS